MGIVDKILSAVTPIDAIEKLIEKAISIPEEREKAQLELEKVRAQIAQNQVEINKLDSQSKYQFSSSWRPFIGYICGICLGLYFIPQYILASILWIKLSWSAGTIEPYPVDARDLMYLVCNMLGFGALRTIEKFNGKN